jgi:hypothetical protein
MRSQNLLLLALWISGWPSFPISLKNNRGLFKVSATRAGPRDRCPGVFGFASKLLADDMRMGFLG